MVAELLGRQTDAGFCGPLLTLFTIETMAMATLSAAVSVEVCLISAECSAHWTSQDFIR